MHTPRIAAVVVTYNRLPLLRRCLAALAACRAACPGAALDLGVLDNASPDGTGAAMAAGADGLIVEVHNDPPHALCDGAQSITPAQFDALMDKLRTLAPCVGRTR